MEKENKVEIYCPLAVFGRVGQKLIINGKVREIDGLRKVVLILEVGQVPKFHFEFIPSKHT